MPTVVLPGRGQAGERIEGSGGHVAELWDRGVSFFAHLWNGDKLRYPKISMGDALKKQITVTR